MIYGFLASRAMCQKHCVSRSFAEVRIEESAHEEKSFSCALFPLPLEIPLSKTRL